MVFCSCSLSVARVVLAVHSGSSRSAASHSCIARPSFVQLPPFIRAVPAVPPFVRPFPVTRSGSSRRSFGQFPPCRRPFRHFSSLVRALAAVHSVSSSRAAVHVGLFRSPVARLLPCISALSSVTLTLLVRVRERNSSRWWTVVYHACFLIFSLTI